MLWRSSLVLHKTLQNLILECIWGPMHRRTGRGGQGAVDPPKFGQIRHLFGQKITHLFDSTPNGTSIRLPDLRFGWGNKGDVHRVLLDDRQKIGTAILHYYFFSLAGPRDKQFVFAIRAKLGLTPPKWMLARTPMGLWQGETFGSLEKPT